MPKADKKTVLLRQWKMVQKIPHRPPGITARELCQHLEEEGYPVNKRTVERDLLMLSESGLKLACNDKSTPYGWYFPKEADATFADLDLAEALSLRMAEETLRASLPPAFLEALEARFKKARRRLDYNPGSPQARWRTKVVRVEPALRLLPPKIDPGVLQTVQTAVLNERCLEVDYRSLAGGRSTTLTLHPLGLVHRGSVTYLIATAFAYTDPRQFALHRILKATATTTCRQAPKGFRLDRYVASGAMGFGEAEPIAFAAAVSPELSAYLAETPLSRDQRIEQAEGRPILRATLQNTWQLHWWILSQGAAIEVLAPQALRAIIAHSLESAFGQYAEQPPSKNQ